MTSFTDIGCVVVIMFYLLMILSLLKSANLGSAKDESTKDE